MADAIAYELEVGRYALDAAAAETLAQTLEAGLNGNERPLFTAGAKLDINMRAVAVERESEALIAVYGFVEAEPLGRVRIDLDLANGEAVVFVLLTEAERAALHGPA